jgi:hypothetical protein
MKKRGEEVWTGWEKMKRRALEGIAMVDEDAGHWVVAARIGTSLASAIACAAG